MGLKEFWEEHISGPPDQFTSYVNIRGEQFRVGDDGLIHLSKEQFHRLQAAHRGVVKPYIATLHPDDTYTLDFNVERKNDVPIRKVQ